MPARLPFVLNIATLAKRLFTTKVVELAAEP
jgi:hypothetical protein